jgi:hypothetical protein
MLSQIEHSAAPGWRRKGKKKKNSRHSKESAGIGGSDKPANEQQSKAEATTTMTTKKKKTFCRGHIGILLCQDIQKVILGNGGTSLPFFSPTC